MTDGQADQKPANAPARTEPVTGVPTASSSTAMARTEVRIKAAGSAPGTLGLSADDPGRDGVRLGLIAFTTLITTLGLFILGAVAERLGIDVWLGAGPLARSLSETFVTGARLPIVMLQSLYASGVEEPLLFAAAMALIIPPIAGLVAARPRQRGGPRPAGAVLAAGGMTAALIIGANLLVAVRLSNSTRPRFEDALVDAGWFDDLSTIAASDGIAMIFSILLAILVFRLPIDRCVRGLAGTIAIATAVVATGAAASSAGVMSLVETPHPIIRRPAIESSMLQIGFNPDGDVVVISIDDVLSRRSIGRDIDFEIVGHRSLASILAATTVDQDQTPPAPRP